jgi:hypothetical protein
MGRLENVLGPRLDHRITQSQATLWISPEVLLLLEPRKELCRHAIIQAEIIEAERPIDRGMRSAKPPAGACLTFHQREERQTTYQSAG